MTNEGEKSMTENYELPVLFTEEERKAYATWGIKKEKVLIPFAIATIVIYLVAAAYVLVKICGVRDSDHLWFQFLVQSNWVGDLAAALAICMTILLLGPINFLLDKIWKKPADPLWLRVEPEGTAVKISQVSRWGGSAAAQPEIRKIAECAAFLDIVDNSIYYQKKWWKIGENTIETIYPPEKRHLWMDHPDNKASGITEVKRLSDILKGYEASLEAARKEQEWLRQHSGEMQQM